LQTTLNVLSKIPFKPLNHDVAHRILEASRGAKKTYLTRARISQLVIFLVAFLLFGSAFFVTFPKVIPWESWIASKGDKVEFVRYYPLFQGASEIIEEQAAWLQMRESFAGSVWEEGGMSPEEFEKTFQVKVPKGGSN